MGIFGVGNTVVRKYLDQTETKNRMTENHIIINFIICTYIKKDVMDWTWNTNEKCLQNFKRNTFEEEITWQT
jgi:hypothetical protein